MKKQPKAVYIIENGGYTELPYEEFCRREQNCPQYSEKLFLPLYGRLMEVSQADYEEFYRMKRRQKYLDERSAANGDFSFDSLTTDEFNGEDILVDRQPDICETIVERIMTDKLRKAIKLLGEDERQLLNELFVENQGQRQLAEKYGCSQVAIFKRKERILAKLKKLMKI